MNFIFKLFFVVFFISDNSFSEVLIHNYNNYKNIKTKIVLSDIIGGLDHPWGMTFVDKQNLIITQKNGEILKINIVSKKIKKIKHQIKSISFNGSNQGGLLDVLYNDGYLYFSYSHVYRENERYSNTAIARGKLVNDEIKNFRNFAYW